MNFQFFGAKQFFMFKTRLLLLNFCLYVYTNLFKSLEYNFAPCLVLILLLIKC